MTQPELFWQIANERSKDIMRDAEKWRLLHSFSQPTWPSRRIRWLMRWLGRWLIRMSQPPQHQDRCWHRFRSFAGALENED